MISSLQSPTKQHFCINDNGLFLVIHLCAMAFTARILFGMIYPSGFDGGALSAGAANALSADFLEIRSTFFWYAGIPFLYILWKLTCGSAAGIVVSVAAGIPGFFAGAWIGRAWGDGTELFFLGMAALFIYPLFVFFKHKWADIHRHSA